MNHCPQRRKCKCKSAFSYSHSLKASFNIQSYHSTQYSYPSHGAHLVHPCKGSYQGCSAGGSCTRQAQTSHLGRSHCQQAKGSWCSDRKGQGKRRCCTSDAPSPEQVCWCGHEEQVCRHDGNTSVPSGPSLGSRSCPVSCPSL